LHKESDVNFFLGIQLSCYHCEYYNKRVVHRYDACQNNLTGQKDFLQKCRTKDNFCKVSLFFIATLFRSLDLLKFLLWYYQQLPAIRNQSLALLIQCLFLKETQEKKRDVFSDGE